MDLGDVRIGLARTDARQTVATALDTIPAPGTEPAIVEQLVQVVADNEGAGVVVGYPRTLQGREGAAAARARRIAAALADEAGVPVILWDERFTTVEAERTMLEQDASRRERRASIDRVAATIILGGVLEARRLGRRQGR